jgi:hypothetical protein
MAGLTKRLKELTRRWRRQAPPAIDLDDPQVRLDFADPGWRVRQSDRPRSVVGWATAAEPIDPDGVVYLVEPIVRNADGTLDTVHGPLDLDYAPVTGSAEGPRRRPEDDPGRHPSTNQLDDTTLREIQKAEHGLSDEQLDAMRELGLL